MTTFLTPPPLFWVPPVGPMRTVCPRNGLTEEPHPPFGGGGGGLEDGAHTRFMGPRWGGGMRPHYNPVQCKPEVMHSTVRHKRICIRYAKPDCTRLRGGGGGL